MNISIVIPVLNEASNIVALLASLQPLRTAGHEVIVVDAGSIDGTRECAATLCDKLINSHKGRALQMNTGARQAAGEMLWFLHADSQLPTDTLQAVPHLFRKHRWGRFDIRLSGKRWTYRVIERMINLRSRLTGIATGDQGIFVERNLFWSIGGYPEIPLMEDIALCRKLKQQTPPTIISHRIQTSSRRWEQNGIPATVLLMWQLRLRYFLGTDPELLAEKYYH